MSNRFYFGEDDTPSEFSSETDLPLPFPKPLNRTSFLTPDFDPATFLSTLASNRFQTLEDLQTELRELGQSLGKELIDLVNDNYHDFLSLGATLAGGEERVEEVRVGLLGFQRDIGEVKGKVEVRRDEVAELLRRKREVRKEIVMGKGLLEVAERLEELEGRLGLSRSIPAVLKSDGDDADGVILENNVAWSDNWDESEIASDDEYDEETGVPTQLRDAVEQYSIIRLLIKRHDARHPFLVSLREPVGKLHETIRLDLEAAVKREDKVESKQKIIQLRASLDDE